MQVGNAYTRAYIRTYIYTRHGTRRRSRGGRDIQGEIGGGGRIGQASFGHIDRLMIARNKGQTVTWSRGRVMDRFRRGKGPRARAVAFNPGGTGEATGCATDRPADDTHQSGGKRNDQVYLPPVLFGCPASPVPCARPAAPKTRRLSRERFR